METKFTPGPWKSVQIEGWEFAVRAGGTVCNIKQKIDFQVEDSVDRTIQGRSENRMRADAHLIAAAPEMYEALAEMLLAFSMENIGVDASLRRCHAKRDARAALTKARGET